MNGTLMAWWVWLVGVVVWWDGGGVSVLCVKSAGCVCKVKLCLLKHATPNHSKSRLCRAHTQQAAHPAITPYVRTFLMRLACDSATMLTANALPGCSIVSRVRSFFMATDTPGGSNEACGEAGRKGGKEGVACVESRKVGKRFECV